MFLSIFIRYILPVLIVATLSSLATKKIVDNNYKAQELVKIQKGIEVKAEMDSELTRIANKSNAVRETQAQVKIVNHTIWKTEIETQTVYRDAKCALPDSGIKTLDETAVRLNNTRK